MGLDHTVVFYDLEEHEVSLITIILERGAFADVVDDTKRRFGYPGYKRKHTVISTWLDASEGEMVLNKIEPTFAKFVRRKRNYRLLPPRFEFRSTAVFVAMVA